MRGEIPQKATKKSNSFHLRNMMRQGDWTGLDREQLANVGARDFLGEGGSLSLRKRGRRARLCLADDVCVAAC